MNQIERGIYYEENYPGVTLGAVVLPNGIIFIDAPLRAEDSRSWRAALLNQASSSNRVLVNLDAHPDRTLGARALDSTIVAHQKTALVFRNRPSVFKGQSLESGAEWEVSNDVLGSRWAVPDITFSHRLLFHWGDSEVVLEHHPGPTPGSIWVIIPEAKVVFVGDTILSDQPPFLASADLSAWIESLNLLISSYKGHTIISGRGGPVTIDEVRTQLRYLNTIVKGLERLAKRSAPPEKTEDLIPKLLADISLPPERREHYVQRLRHGLYHYYTRHYRSFDQAETD
jgi:glyoxylase-like metal-dependent hydrolase (beta-lactamase superfamily II)